MRRFIQLASNPLAQLQRRFERSRPGSILIFVIALLVLLALMGTAYISTARLDRFAAQGGNSGEDVNRDANDALQAAVNEAISMAKQDLNPVTTPWPSQDPLASPSSIYLASLAPDVKVPADPLDPYPIQPTWRYLTRRKNQLYDAIYSSAAINGAPTTFDFNMSPASSTFTNPWRVIPTNLIVHYNAATMPGIGADLDGRTYVFPAILRWRKANGAAVKDGPYLAGDATGWGVADSVGFKLLSTKSATYYAFLRIVDNAAAVNVNTAWAQNNDLDINNNCRNFFPCDIDLSGMLHYPGTGTTTTELNDIDSVRVKTNFVTLFGAGPTTERPQREGGATVRGDVYWLSAADGFWNQYGRRTLHPHLLWGDRTVPATPTRAFDPPTSPGGDTGGLRFHGVMAQNPPQPASYFERKDLGVNQVTPAALDTAGTNYNVANSTDRAAMNYVTNGTDQFQYVPANQVGLWYDWNYNQDNTPGRAGSPMVFPLSAMATPPLGTDYDGNVFRCIKGLLVASNPVQNFTTMHSMATLPGTTTLTPLLAGGADLMPNWSASPQIAPHKTSLNTASFGELWRAYWNVIAEKPNPTTEMFHCPGVDLSNTNGKDSAINFLSNTIRDPKYANSDPKLGRGNASNLPRLRLDCYNMALLRSAIAAVNTIDFRDSTGMSGATKVGNVRSKTITLQATGSPNPLTVHVYGNEAQPFITEVYANTDTSKSQDPNAAMKQNKGGYVAIKLYNPYPVTLNLAGYKFWIINRKSTAGYPNLTYKEIIPAAIPSMPANTYLTLENFNPGATGNDATYRPRMVAPDNNAHSSFHFVTGLGQVLDDTTTANPGGELVILRPITNGGGGGDWVPVDSYDFTGLTLMQDPAVIPAGPLTQGNGWHYVRMSGASSTTSWKCVYPGRYNATAGNGSPRQEGTEVEMPWDPSKNQTEPWLSAAPTTPFSFPLTTAGADVTASSYPNLFPPIRLNVDMFSRYTKYKAANNSTQTFPYGGFARVGDVEMIPFIGAYKIDPTTNAANTVGEVNAISMDASFADDGDDTNNSFEQIGRFCPLVDPSGLAGGYNDYAGYGQYLSEKTPPVVPANQVAAKYAYHWAVDVMDNFTVVSNPQDDYLPNIGTYLENVSGTTPLTWPANPRADAVANGTVVANANAGKEDFAPVEGLININTAPWQVLARIEWLPAAAFTTTAAANAANRNVAKWIVSYRDVDGGIKDVNGDPLPHGPFNSLLELNDVFNPTTPTQKFRHGFGAPTVPAGSAFPTNKMPSEIWGNYAVVTNPTVKPMTTITNQLGADWANETLMVSRVSNLLTTRSDSFTAYVMIQGWKNVGTDHPVLVVQRRAAMLLDRSNSLPAVSNTVTTYSLPTK